MSDYQKGTAVWTWTAEWVEGKLRTNIIHGTVRSVTDSVLDILPDGIRADPNHIVHQHVNELSDTKDGAHKKLSIWLHVEFKERADTMHDLQKEICSIAAAQAVNDDRMFWNSKKHRKDKKESD